MRITYVAATVSGPTGNAAVDFLVDSGAHYTLLPEGVIILGQPGDVALPGAVTLEELGLVLNPFSRTLHPAALLPV